MTAAARFAVVSTVTAEGDVSVELAADAPPAHRRAGPPVDAGGVQARPRGRPAPAAPHRALARGSRSGVAAAWRVASSRPMRALPLAPVATLVLLAGLGASSAVLCGCTGEGPQHGPRLHRGRQARLRRGHGVVQRARLDRGADAAARGQAQVQLLEVRAHGGAAHRRRGLRAGEVLRTRSASTRTSCTRTARTPRTSPTRAVAIAEATYAEMPEVGRSSARRRSAIRRAWSTRTRSSARTSRTIPNAKESAHVRELLALVVARLVLHELYVARFYLAKDNYEAAVARIQYALHNYAAGGGDLDVDERRGGLRPRRRGSAPARQDVPQDAQVERRAAGVRGDRPRARREPPRHPGARLPAAPERAGRLSEATMADPAVSGSRLVVGPVDAAPRRAAAHGARRRRREEHPPHAAARARGRGLPRPRRRDGRAGARDPREPGDARRPGHPRREAAGHERPRRARRRSAATRRRAISPSSSSAGTRRSTTRCRPSSSARATSSRSRSPASACSSACATCSTPRKARRELAPGHRAAARSATR